MIDIVKRLDRLANAEIIPLTTAWEIAKVASKEITRLREENKRAFAMDQLHGAWPMVSPPLFVRINNGLYYSERV